MWTRTENQIETVSVVLIRHGETSSNRERRYLGRTDEALSPEGRKIILSYREAGRYPKAELVFSSPMKRCLETAEILYPGKKIMIIPDWKEIDFGLFERKNYEELKSCPEYIRWLESGGTLPFPGGESREEFIRRSVNGFSAMMEQAYGNVGNAAAVVHGGTIMAILSRYGGGDYFDYQVKNAGGYRFLASFNGTSEEKKYRITETEAL